MLRPILAILCLLLLPAFTQAGGVQLTVQVPAEVKIRSAEAQVQSMKLQTEGKIDKQSIRFERLLPEVFYDLKLTLQDGTILQGVNMNWYNEEPAKKKAEPLNDDDREQIRAQVVDIPSFYDRKQILLLQGNHDRAVALVCLARDKAFWESKKGEVIWRIELWYLKNQAGGWEIISQQNKVLRRERFQSAEAYKAAQNIRWIKELGGIRLGKNQKSATLTLPPLAATPATQKTTESP